MNSFIFIDESGVLAHDPNQPFFGIGMLKIQDTSQLYERFQRIKSRAGVKEFKFSDVTLSTCQYYEALLNEYFRFSLGYYSVFVLDKYNPRIKVRNYYSNTWDAYVGFSKLLIRKNLGGDKCCVVADYLDRPGHIKLSYEETIRSISKDNIFNATMLESHAALMIQLVDVLTGSVLFDFRRERYPQRTANKPKADIVKVVKRHIARRSLADNFTVSSPNYFSVWEFKP